MPFMNLLLVGPEGPERATIETTLRALGHAVQSVEPGSGPMLSIGDAVVVDARCDARELREVTEALLDDDRPLVVVTDGPRRNVGALSQRPSGAMVLTDSESAAGYRVALGVCAAMRRRRTRRPLLWAAAS